MSKRKINILILLDAYQNSQPQTFPSSAVYQQSRVVGGVHGGSQKNYVEAI